MRREVLFFVFFLGVQSATYCPKAPTTPGDRREDKTKLTIATYNTEWLFLADDGSTDCPGDGCAWKTAKEATDHMALVAEVIKKLDADILNVAEVRSCGVLEQLNALLPTMKYEPYMISGVDGITNQNVGLLTRIDPVVDLKRSSLRSNYPIVGSTCQYNVTESDTTVSKHYYTTFNITNLNKPLGLIGAHLVAFPTNKDRCVQREGQATVLANLVNQEFSKSYQIIAGDFNDFDPSVPDLGGSVALSSSLKIMRGDNRINIASKVNDVTQRYSYWYDANNNCKVETKEMNVIDHMLVSKDLSGKVTNVEFFHYNAPNCTSKYSDHWPVKMTLDLLLPDAVDSNNEMNDAVRNGGLWMTMIAVMALKMLF
eukprot:TRINITY_DN171_c0_g1_i3.p1 TRINITY_DN171_c0_g1~~TRINITY_DN171_c0_g1_i3.p1  ORF type:complete len:385 (-),score=84.06 TRINITY_DN171_c0_g1_i3:69-1178(-)